MGTDLHGWVEVRHRRLGTWDGVVRIHNLIERSSSHFAALFGMPGVAAVAAVAHARGNPTGVSAEARLDQQPGDIETTWIGWDELQRAIGNSAFDSFEAPVHRFNAPAFMPGWEALFQIMLILAQKYGNDGVRLVVWFDSY